jgi:hypothetical protein
MSLTRVPSASSTSALFAIPLLLAGDPPDRFVLVHEFVFGGTPGRDHRVKVLSSRSACASNSSGIRRLLSVVAMALFRIIPEIIAAFTKQQC